MVSQLTAINVAKMITIAIVIILIAIVGISDQRQILYACMHISYCVWWLLEQRIYPERRTFLFQEKVGPIGLISAVLIIGVFYSLPAFLAFFNSNPLTIAATATAIPLFYFGSLINTSADVQKMTAKTLGRDLVSDGIWSRIRHVNYSGDLMRYLSFAVVAGSAWAFLVPLAIAALYLQRIGEKEIAMGEKYPDFAAYRQRTTRLIPWVW